MDDSQRYFTLAILGQPRRLVLGRQVRYDNDPVFATPTDFDAAAARSGDGEPTSPAQPEGEGKPHPSPDASWTWRGFAPTAAFGLMLAAIAFTLANWSRDMTSSRQQVQLTPQDAAAMARQVARAASVGALPLARPDQEPTPSNPAIAVMNEPAPLPTDSPNHPATTIAPSAVIAAAKVATAGADRAVALSAEPPAKSADKRKPKDAGEIDAPKLLVVDVSAANGLRTGQMGNMPTPAPPSQKGYAQPVAEKSQKVQSVSGGSKPARLVAFTPDGVHALLSTVAGKAPQKFKVGDKLPSGETIQGIDATAGKIVFDNQTVLTLE